MLSNKGKKGFKLMTSKFASKKKSHMTKRFIRTVQKQIKHGNTENLTTSTPRPYCLQFGHMPCNCCNCSAYISYNF